MQLWCHLNQINPSKPLFIWTPYWTINYFTNYEGLVLLFDHNRSRYNSFILSFFLSRSVYNIPSVFGFISPRYRVPRWPHLCMMLLMLLLVLWWMLLLLKQSLAFRTVVKLLAEVGCRDLVRFSWYGPIGCINGDPFIHWGLALGAKIERAHVEFWHVEFWRRTKIIFVRVIILTGLLLGSAISLCFLMWLSLVILWWRVIVRVFRALTLRGVSLVHVFTLPWLITEIWFKVCLTLGLLVVGTLRLLCCQFLIMFFLSRIVWFAWALFEIVHPFWHACVEKILELSTLREHILWEGGRVGNVAQVWYVERVFIKVESLVEIVDVRFPRRERSGLLVFGTGLRRVVMSLIRVPEPWIVFFWKFSLIVLFLWVLLRTVFWSMGWSRQFWSLVLSCWAEKRFFDSVEGNFRFFLESKRFFRIWRIPLLIPITSFVGPVYGAMSFGRIYRCIIAIWGVSFVDNGIFLAMYRRGRRWWWMAFKRRLSRDGGTTSAVCIRISVAGKPVPVTRRIWIFIDLTAKNKYYKLIRHFCYSS